jgi:hypothetical protein
MEVPGIAGVSLSLTQYPAWSDPQEPDQVEGDPYPAGTQGAIFKIDLVVHLAGSIPGGDITGFAVDDDQLAYAIPVLVNQGDGSTHVEYRLWKWCDLGMDGPRSEDASWSTVKALY